MTQGKIKIIAALLSITFILCVSSSALSSAEKSYVIPLREHIESRLNAIEKAVAIALAANDKRLDSMNEFRQTLRDQQNLFATVAEVRQLRDDVQGLKESRAELSGKASQQSVIVAYVISTAGLVIGLVGIFRRRQCKDGE